MPSNTTCRTARPEEDLDLLRKTECCPSASTGLARKISNSLNMIKLTNKLIINKESTLLAVILRAAS